MNLFIRSLPAMAFMALTAVASPVTAGDATGHAPIELAQSGSPRPGGRPPREAFEACASKAVGDPCQVPLQGGSTLTGTCQQPPQGRDNAKLCVPAGAPPRG